MFSKMSLWSISECSLKVKSRSSKPRLAVRVCPFAQNLDGSGSPIGRGSWLKISEVKVRILFGTLKNGAFVVSVTYRVVVSENRVRVPNSAQKFFQKKRECSSTGGSVGLQNQRLQVRDLPLLLSWLLGNWLFENWGNGYWVIRKLGNDRFFNFQITNNQFPNNLSQKWS